MSDNLLPDNGEITTRDVTSGYVAHLHDGDGNSTSHWGVTEAKARQKAQNAAMEESNDD